MTARIHFYGTPLDGPLQVTSAALTLVVHADRVTLAIDIASETEPPPEPPEPPDPDAADDDQSESGDWMDARFWWESLPNIRLGNVEFDADLLPTVLTPGKRLSLARPVLDLPLRSRDGELYVMLFGHAHRTSGELHIEPASAGFDLRWSGVVEEFSHGEGGRFLVEIDGVGWDRIDLQRIPVADRAAAVARWFDDTESYRLMKGVLVPRRKATPDVPRSPATVSLVFRTIEGLIAAAEALDLTRDGRPLRAASDFIGRDTASVQGTLWLRPLGRKRNEPDYGFSVDVADAAALEARSDGAVALRLGGSYRTGPETMTLDLTSAEDAGGRIICASAGVHLPLTVLLETRGGVRGAIRSAEGNLAWTWSAQR